MADILIDDESVPAAPAASTGLIYNDNISKVLTERTSVKVATVGAVRNQSAAAQAYTTSEIYLTGSSLSIPSHLIQVGATFNWQVVLTKTAGTAAPVFKIKIGTLGTTGDADIVSFTGFATPSSNTDTAWVTIMLLIRTIGASATSEGAIRMNHQLAATGFSNLTTAVERKDGTAFNSTTASLIAGVTFNHSTAGAGNIEIVTAELVNS
jgi:hypothetical protein